MKPKLNQFTELRERFQAKRAAKKPFEARGGLANEGRRKEPKPAKVKTMYDEKGNFNASFRQNWLI
jgi:hypothetical protein